MAKDLALNLNTMDLKYPPQFITGKAELQQSLIIRLMTPKGSLAGNPDVGLDMSYLKKRFNPDELRLAVDQCLRQDQRVTNVKEVHIKRKNDTVYVSIDVSTTLGEINMNKEMKSNAPD